MVANRFTAQLRIDALDGVGPPVLYAPSRSAKDGSLAEGRDKCALYAYPLPGLYPRHSADVTRLKDSERATLILPVKMIHPSKEISQPISEIMHKTAFLSGYIFIDPAGDHENSFPQNHKHPTKISSFSNNIFFDQIKKLWRNEIFFLYHL